MAEQDREKQIKSEVYKLKKIFKDLPDDRKKLAENLIQNAAFMAITLRDLQADIGYRGPVITQVNGNGFETTMENPSQKSYSTLINRYATVIKQLADMLPDAKEDAIHRAGADLTAFIKKGKPNRK